MPVMDLCGILGIPQRYIDGDRVRIISVRRARDEEIGIYEV
jgi:hypothetical protein